MNLQESIDELMKIARELWNKVKEVVSKLATFFKKIYAKAKLIYGNKRTKRIAYLALYSNKYRVRKKNVRLLLKC